MIPDSREVDASEAKVALWEEMDRLQEWASKNLKKFNKHKCKAFYMGKHNLGVQHKLGSTQLESSTVEMDLGVLMDSNLNMTGHCAAVPSKANRMLRSTGTSLAEMSSCLSGHAWNTVFTWSSLYKKDVLKECLFVPLLIQRKG